MRFRSPARTREPIILQATTGAGAPFPQPAKAPASPQSAARGDDDIAAEDHAPAAQRMIATLADPAEEPPHRSLFAHSLLRSLAHFGRAQATSPPARRIGRVDRDFTIACPCKCNDPDLEG